jgi:Ca2+-binding RTX toxin-like protein
MGDPVPPLSVTIFASDPGTYFLEDDGVPGNNFSRVRFPDGTTINFEHPTDDLIFDPSVAGITLVVNLTDSLGTSRFSTGDFTDPTSSPDFIKVNNIVTAAGVTLVANNTITEFSADVGADIVAGSLVLSAGTGVGTVGNAIETQVGTIEAETTTGGINLSNFGTVSIGGLTAEVDGLDVATSGNITFTSFGSIVLSDNSGPESVHGGATSGNVTLTANGVDSDILANIDRDSISAPRGNIVVSAGRDIGFGLIGNNFDNDVRANGSITFNAGRDLLLDGFADVVSDAFGEGTGGDVIVNAGRNVTLLAVAGTDAGIEAGGSAGANIILNTGPGGTVTLNSGNGTAPFASLISQSGDIVINADRMSIGTNGAISTVNGQVTIQPKTQGWDVDLGSVTDAAFALELSDAEIDRIFTTTLNIGSLESGRLDVTSAISPLNALNLILRAGTDIGIASSMTVGGELTLRAGDNIFQLPASAINVGGAFGAFVDEAGDDLGSGGVATANGSINATSAIFRGNAENDTLNGASANDILFGNGGNDTLSGFGGADVLDGGTGADTMIGGLGDDDFVVDNPGDVVIEEVGEGDDTVKVGFSLTLAANVENLTLTGNAAINGTGNALANTLLGNTANNILDGKLGADTMRGGIGDDTYVVDNVGDVVLELAGQGTDLVQAGATFTIANNIENLTLTGVDNINGTGNALANTLLGNAGNNILDGKAGADTMTGGLGGDTYVVDNAGDVVTEAGAGTDTVQSTITFALGASFENLTLTGGAAVNGTGNTLVNILTGNGAANTLNGLGGHDTLNGGSGADLLLGGLGNDIYMVDNVGDVAAENAGEGTDLVQSSVTFTLGANVENLTLTGAAINATGNALANILTGNAASNTLNGGTGADTMIGGLGSDTYVVDNAGDVVTEGAGVGTDLVQSSVTFTLGANFENLTLTGAAISGTGNTLANILTGNGASNTLNGGTGADTMIGGLGSDTYVVDNAGDIVTEGAGAGTDTVQSTVTFTLGANVENLTMSGVAIDGTGNALANTLLGNALNNVLSGLGGNDQINGGVGIDYIFGGAGNDDLTGGAGEDRYQFDAVLNVDDILDFSVTDDRIFLDRDIFTGIAVNGSLAASAFVNGTVAGDATDRIVYDSATGNIFYDADGLAGSAQTLFATVTAGTALTNLDFFAYV